MAAFVGGTCALVMRTRSNSSVRDRAPSSDNSGKRSNKRRRRSSRRVPPPTPKEGNLTRSRTARRTLSPESCPALVLNADYQVLSYTPLSLWPWQEVIKAVVLGRVNVVETYSGIGIRSPGVIHALPSVVSLKRYQPPARRTAAFTRFNVFLRDSFECQYCGKRCVTQDLTFDHVVPRCRGGRTNWENVVSACVSCNHAKGRFLLRDLAPAIRLRRAPIAPSQFQLQANARLFPPRNLHESWRDYVYWTQRLDEEEDVEDSPSLDDLWRSSRSRAPL